MKQTKWIERKFTFDFPVSHLPNVLERLRGTTVRLEALANSITEEQAIMKRGDAWSIQEHIGHLGDLESLHDGRIDDFIVRKQVLRAADMSNIATSQANHNNTSMKELLSNFTLKRTAFIERLESLDDETLNFSTLHPRLQIMMRPVDMAFFTAEHDDHHFSSIREILNQF